MNTAASETPFPLAVTKTLMQEETLTSIEMLPKGYYKRILNSLFLPGILLLIGYIIINLSGGFTGIFKLLVPVYLLFVLFSVYANRFYITKIAWNEAGQLFVTYSDFNTTRSVSTNIATTGIYKGLLWKPNSRQAFLVLKIRSQSNGANMKQFTTGDWTNKKFDELLQAWPSTRHTANSSFQQ